MEADIFWKRVRELIKAHKISQEKFAQHIDIPKSTFYGWQQQRRFPEVRTAYDMAAALGVSMEYLITGEDNENALQRMKQVETWKKTELNMKKLLKKMRNEMYGAQAVNT